MFLSLDGRLCEGGNVSEPPTGSSDRPLTQQSNPVSYAGSLKRAEPAGDGTPPRHNAGKPVPSPSTSPFRLESYATVLQQGKSGPQEVGEDQISEIDIILDGRGNCKYCTMYSLPSILVSACTLWC
jgi:hypothetical protein